MENELLQKIFEKLVSVETKIGSMEADVKEMKMDIAVLKTDVAVLKTDVTVLKEGQRKIERTLDTLADIVGGKLTRLDVKVRMVEEYVATRIG